MRKCRQRNILLPKPKQNLANAAQLGHFTKNQLNGLLHALVGILFQFTACCPTETDGNLNLQFATAGFLKNGNGRPKPFFRKPVAEIDSTRIHLWCLSFLEVSDPTLTNDRLLLGMKGTISEYELNLFRQRSTEI